MSSLEALVLADNGLNAFSVLFPLTDQFVVVDSGVRLAGHIPWVNKVSVVFTLGFDGLVDLELVNFVRNSLRHLGSLNQIW
jgi:hypothetical protein